MSSSIFDQARTSTGNEGWVSSGVPVMLLLGYSRIVMAVGLCRAGGVRPPVLQWADKCVCPRGFLSPNTAATLSEAKTYSAAAFAARYRLYRNHVQHRAHSSSSCN